MTVSIRRAEQSDAKGIHHLLANSTLNSRDTPFELRNRIFEERWGRGSSPPGYLMENEQQIVGFLGTLCTERTVKAKTHKFCELHSWYVQDEFRNQSLLLLMPALSDRRATILNYTPSQPVYDIGKKFGFQDLETGFVSLFPRPTRSRGLRLITDPNEICALLSPTDVQIYRDHSAVGCRHFAVKTGDAVLYLVIKAMRRGWFEPYFGKVLYISDRQLFARVNEWLRWQLCVRHGWACLVVRPDFLDPKYGFFTRLLVRDIPSQYKSSSLKGEDIFPLYSYPLLAHYSLH